MGLNLLTRGSSAFAVLACGAGLMLFAGCSGPSSSTVASVPSSTHQAQRAHRRAGSTPIQHVVVIVQENRTIDNIFNGFPGADTAQSGLDSNGNVHQLKPISFSNTCGPSHSHSQFVTEFNNSANNGWEQASYSCSGSDTLPDGVYAYVNKNETAAYWAAASNYALADEVEQTSEGPSFPAHQYLIAGQAGGHGSDAPWGFAENGGGSSSGGITDEDEGGDTSPDGGAHGCGAKPDISVVQIDLTSAFPGNEGNPQYPCKDYQTVFDLAMAQNPPVSWKYYAHKTGNLWSGPDAVQHLWQAGLHATVPETTVLNDIANGKLADIVFVTPSPKTSDHPHSAPVPATAGPKWVASIVNAIGSNPAYWNSTTILITWDDWGGWFDHVTPVHPPGLPTDPYEWGYRVPLVVISPYVKPHQVDHTNRTFNSITAYIESVFNLGSLGFQDSPAYTDDLSDMFNYGQSPLPFIAMPTK